MEMIHRRRQQFLVEHVITTWSQVDVLAIARQLFIERFDQEKIDRSFEIDRRRAILLWWNLDRRIDWFWEMLLEHLLPVGQIETLEHIFELQERSLVVQIYFLRSADENIDSFIESKLDSKVT